MHVSILVPAEAALLNSIERSFKIFNWANDYSTRNGRDPLFDLHLVGMTDRVDLYGGHFSIKPDLVLEDVFETDLVIIPALAGDIAESLKNNIAFIPWLKQQYKRGAKIAGLCTGAFLLADTNLTDEAESVRHWFVETRFRKEFTQIDSVAKKVMVAPQNIVANGAYSFINVLLESLAGKEAAIACSVIFEKGFNQECQSVITISNAQTEKAGQPHKNKLIETIAAEQFEEKFSLNRTTSKAGDPPYNNSKKIKEIFKKAGGLHDFGR